MHSSHRCYSESISKWLDRACVTLPSDIQWKTVGIMATGKMELLDELAWILGELCFMSTADSLDWKFLHHIWTGVASKDFSSYGHTASLLPNTMLKNKTIKTTFSFVIYWKRSQLINSKFMLVPFLKWHKNELHDSFLAGSFHTLPQAFQSLQIWWMRSSG